MYFYDIFKNINFLELVITVTLGFTLNIIANLITNRKQTKELTNVMSEEHKIENQISQNTANIINQIGTKIDLLRDYITKRKPKN